MCTCVTLLSSKMLCQIAKSLMYDTVQKRFQAGILAIPDSVCPCVKMLSTCCFAAFMLLAITTLATADTFTSLSTMEDIVSVEADLKSAWQGYLTQETDRIDKIRKLSEDYFEAVDKCKSEGEECFANPVDAYLLMKRMVENNTKLNDLLDNSKSNKGLLGNITALRSSKNVEFPESEDIESGGLAVLRLQETYNLTADDLRNGSIANVKPGLQFTAKDSFDLGVVAQTNNDHFNAILWMQKALQPVDNTNQTGVDKKKILEFLAFSLYQQGNVKRALNMSKQLLEMDPKNIRVEANVKFYLDQLKLKNDTDNDILPDLINNRSKIAEIRNELSQLCQGHNLVVQTSTRLRCYYKTDSPFLKLAPLKVEIAHLRPKILLFRNAISDQEIDLLKALAKPKLQRAPVVRGNAIISSNTRTSKNAWLERNNSVEIGMRIDRRIADMTNLNITASELLQVANYGLGGFYDPHCDFATKDQIQRYGYHGFYQPHLGNRIATVLIYLNTPYAGGTTVFPELNISISCTKHDVVFWHNLKPNGLGDEATLHAACPVLAGAKWVVNKWITERGQEFYRKCGLSEHFYE